jgi:hypothetical protein
MKTLQANSPGVGSWGDVGADFCPPFSDYRDTKLMAANVARSFTVPADARKVFFNVTPSGTTFWVDDSKAAVIPTDVANGSAPEMNPAGRMVTPGQSLSVITSVAGAIVGVSYYG